MFAKSVKLPLFATPVRGFDLPEDDARTINAGLLAMLDAWFSPRPELKPGETWQTTHNLHEHNDFAPLYPFVDQAIQLSIDGLGLDDKNYVITGCWANINPPGGLHPPHTHPNNLISGVYYMRTPVTADEIIFHDPRPQAHVIQPIVTQGVPEVQTTIGVEAKPGRMLVFPSWLRHSVKPNYTQEERASLSFNVMLTDFIDRHAMPQWRGFRENGTRG